MDKQKILEWANKLIEDYENCIGRDTSYVDYDEYEKDEQHCDELRQEIKKLLELD